LHDKAWFDPIEMGIRERIRGFIEGLVGEELNDALGRARYRRPSPAAGGDRCPLDDFALKGRDREPALLSIRLRYIPTSRRLCPIRSSLDSCMQVLDPAIEVCLIILPWQPIHARSGFPLESKVRRPKHR
jgi:hypothetical protein